MVYSYRFDLAQKIYRANIRDIGKSSFEQRDRRWALYESVTYGDMVWSFKPISSFYEDKDFEF